MDTNISPTQLPLDQLRQIRIQKINKIRELGIDPYLASGNRSHDISEIVDNFEKLEGSNVSVCGRILSWREHGALAFADVSDESGHIQLYLKADQGMLFNAEKGTLDFEKLNLLDIGDFVEVTGEVTKTKRGEISILVHELKLLTKSVRPLPSMHFGIKDEEERYRQRYVDFILNPELRELFYKKAKFWNSFRSFLLEKGFLEVETPVLENTAGGADARPFVTHHNSLDIDVFLRISMGELGQKDLWLAGFEKLWKSWET